MKAFEIILLGFCFFTISCSALYKKAHDNKTNGTYREMYGRHANCEQPNEHLAFHLQSTENNKTKMYDYILSIKDGFEVVWQDEWSTSFEDQNEILLQEGSESYDHWMKQIFIGTLEYGIDFDCVSLDDSQIQLEIVKDYCLSNDFDNKKILEHLRGTRFVIAYRKKWREDLLKAAYIPELLIRA